MEQEQDIRPLSARQKAEFLKRAKEHSTDENPVWVKLRHPELLPWAGMGGLIPQQGILVGLIEEKSERRKFPTAIVLDFTRMRPFVELPYARLPLSAVEIDKEKKQIWIDCIKAVDIGIGVPFNYFMDRSKN